MGLGWQLGRWQAAGERNDLRQDLMREMALNQARLRECQLNMENQFTPGFKASLPILWEDGRPVLSLAQGEIFRTQNSTNLAINGPGFFQVGEPLRPVYTRDGRFQLQHDRLEDEQGRPLLGYVPDQERPVACPELAPGETIRVDELGRVFAETSRYDPALGVVNKSSRLFFVLALAQPEHPEHLARFGASGLVSTSGSGKVTLGTPSALQNAVLVPGALELANVDFYQQGAMIAALRNQAGMLGAAPPAPPPMASGPMFPLSRSPLLPGEDPLKLR